MSVFWKLVISFWLAIALSIAATIFFYPPPHRETPHSPPPEVKAGLDLNGQYLIDLINTNHVDEARTYSESLASNHVLFYVFDEHGNQLVGRPAPPEVVATAAQSSDKPQTQRIKDLLYSSESEVLKNGSRVTVVAVFPDRHPPFYKFFLPRIVIFGIISGLVCYALAKYLTTPLFALRRATHRLAEGDLTARAASRTHAKKDEINSLIADFNAMAERIETLVTLQTRLTTDISHELRSPLARLSVALEIAREKSGPQALAALDRIETEAERLNELVGQILMLSRLESGSDKTAPISVDMNELLHDVADDASFEATKKGCTVNLSMGSNCAIEGNRELLRRSLDNVLRNAIHYTAAGSSIDVALDFQNGDGPPPVAIVRIRDRGVGVPENELQNIFQPFHRVAGDRARQSGGAGLGLAICDRAVRLHGGRVSAQNAKDGGLIIEIMLPAIRARVGESLVEEKIERKA